MNGLLHREDIDEVRERISTWWRGGDIGPPSMELWAPRKKPLEDVEGTWQNESQLLYVHLLSPV
jgi:hypothetical protein